MSHTYMSHVTYISESCLFSYLLDHLKEVQSRLPCHEHSRDGDVVVVVVARRHVDGPVVSVVCHVCHVGV